MNTAYNVVDCSAPNTVVMLGTAQGMMGGVSSVVDIYASQGFLAHWRVEYIVTHIDGSAAKKVLIGVRALFKFLFVFLRYRPAVLHVHVSPHTSFWRKFFFVLVAQAKKCDVILHLHGDDFDIFYNELSPFLQAQVVKVVSRCALIIVLSEQWRSIQFFNKLVPHVPIQCIPNPVVIPARTALDNGQRQGKKYLLFLGKLATTKGVFDLINAFSIVVKQHPQTVLQLGGNGAIDEARSLIAALGLENNVELLGWVQGPQKDRLLANATAYVLPSYNEGLPMGVLEAMAYGVPVVATPVGGIPSAVRDGIEGILIPVGDVAALSTALLQICANPDLARTMGVAGHLRAQTLYSAPVILAKVSAIYRTCLQQYRNK